MADTPPGPSMWGRIASRVPFTSAYMGRLREAVQRMREHHPPPPTPTGGLPPKSVFPGPLGFALSGYALGLIGMCILLDRIQNVVAPRSRHSAHEAYVPSRWRRFPLVNKVWDALLPVDLNSTRTRIVLQAPSMFLLGRVILIWSVMLLQTHDAYPSLPLLARLGEWVAGMEMSDICWRTYVAINVTLCASTAMRGLDGSSTRGVPFNMVGYSFLLHIYSSSITHEKIDDSPSRPNPDLLFVMFLPILQLTMIHYMGISKSHANQRLIPSAITTILGLIHFHTSFWSSPATYPLFNSSLIYTLLLAIIVFNAGLKALTQLLLEGTITLRPIMGHATLVETWDEDFGFVIVRAGIASLDATEIAGLGNEVGGLVVSDPKKSQRQGTKLEIGRDGVRTISRLPGGTVGFKNEIKDVSVAGGGGGGGEDAASNLMDMRKFKEMLRLVKTFAIMGRGAWRYVRGRRVVGVPVVVRASTAALQIEDNDDEEGEEEDAPADDYARFVRGENVSDDEGEYNPHTPDDSSDSSDEDDEDDEGPGNETVNLYADLSTVPTEPTLMIAHMTDASTSPLTRHRYGTLVSSSSTISRASPAPGGGGVTERSCVICTVEPRQIVCWPCRCLALCDECRENLASRSSASSHKCPCCRQTVEGFSRIFIP